MRKRPWGYSDGKWQGHREKYLPFISRKEGNKTFTDLLIF